MLSCDCFHHSTISLLFCALARYAPGMFVDFCWASVSCYSVFSNFSPPTFSSAAWNFQEFTHRPARVQMRRVLTVNSLQKSYNSNNNYKRVQWLRINKSTQTDCRKVLFSWLLVRLCDRFESFIAPHCWYTHNFDYSFYFFIKWQRFRYDFIFPFRIFYYWFRLGHFQCFAYQTLNINNNAKISFTIAIGFQQFGRSI